jgi:hypothetical protein
MPRKPKPPSDAELLAAAKKLAQIDERPMFAPARGGPASGPGWGGAANGSGSGRQFDASAAEAARALNDDPLTIKMRARRKRTAAERRARMREILEDVAEDSEYDSVRVVAADKLLDRLEGKARQFNVNLDLTNLDGLSDEQLLVIASGGGSEAAAPEGDQA